MQILMLHTSVKLIFCCLTFFWSMKGLILQYLTAKVCWLLHPEIASIRFSALLSGLALKSLLLSSCQLSQDEAQAAGTSFASHHKSKRIHGCQCCSLSMLVSWGDAFSLIVLMTAFPVKLHLNMNKTYFFMKKLLMFCNTIPYGRAQLLW